MHRSPRSPLWCACLVGALLSLAALESHAGDRDAGPARATSHDPDGLVVEAGQMDSRLTKSRGPDGLTTKAGNPDDRRARSGNSDDDLTTSENPDNLVVESTNVDDLPWAQRPSPARSANPANPAKSRAHDDRQAVRPATGASNDRVYSFTPSAPGASGDGHAGGSWEGQLAVAKARLDGARRDAERWDAAYQRLPASSTSGQQRADIDTRRRKANAEIEEARAELDRLATEAERAGVSPTMIRGLIGSD